MTFGQRIAQKRKELGLSQEGLGEQLGVSRQAIYKWESNASLPEIDKLITLSKIFAVSVGWLLGVEEDSPPQGDVELNETQLAMVQEIANRYLSAQPKLQKSSWDKWSVRILFAMCGIMLALLVGANSRIKAMEEQYVYMANSIGEVSYSVDSQIGTITSRVEEILKSQNALTADWSAELVSTDLAASTATFDVRAVPKTYVEGMTALFVAHSGEDTVELPVEPGADHAFSGQITCPLTDQIDVSVVFLTEDKRETQWLNGFYSLYSDTFPDLSLDNVLWIEIEGGVLSAGNTNGLGTTVRNPESRNLLSWNPDPPAKLQVGLFQDQKLVMWYEGGIETVRVNNTFRKEYIWRRPQDVTLKPGHEYCEAAVYTDEYGRQRIYQGIPIVYNTAEQDWLPRSSVALNSDPAAWEF